MTTKQPVYQAYLLRLWPADATGAGPAIWRASLEEPHTGKRLGFSSLEALFVYLMEQTEAGTNFSIEEGHEPIEP